MLENRCPECFSHVSESCPVDDGTVAGCPHCGATLRAVVDQSDGSQTWELIATRTQNQSSENQCPVCNYIPVSDFVPVYDGNIEDCPDCGAELRAVVTTDGGSLTWETAEEE